MVDGRSLWELIERRAAATPDALCLVDERERALDFAGFLDACERAAAGLHALGVGSDDVVSWVLPTRLEALVLAGALARLGAVQNPILPIYRHREVGFVTRQLDAKLLCVPGVFRGFDYPAMAGDLARAQSGLETLVVEDTLPAGDPRTLPAAPSPPATPEQAPVRWVLYTSGTTSDPKGARHTDATLLATTRGMVRVLDLREDDRHGFAFPVTHVGGIGWLMAGMLSGLAHLLVDVWNPQKTIPFFARHGITLAGAGTAFHQAYLAAQREKPERPLFPHVRSFPGGGAPKPPQLHFDIKNEMGGVGIVSGYGLTECPIIAMNTTRDPDAKLAHTEGRANPEGAEIHVVKHDGSLAAPGEEGELHIRGPQLCRGYVDAALNDSAFADGWFRTGDLGILDEDGFVTITGRLKDVIIRKGENISAKEVEDLLYAHPDVSDVAVIGLPDPALGERCCAVVAGTLTFDAMVAHLRDRQLMVQKIPEQLEIVDEIPRNPAGKILKQSLRDRFAT
jgi:acyl-CoA synthetase (AMP-forming)/AMP-acid ligase II